MSNLKGEQLLDENNNQEFEKEKQVKDVQEKKLIGKKI
jgi:hypothetical protein